MAYLMGRVAVIAVIVVVVVLVVRAAAKKSRPQRDDGRGRDSGE